MPANPIAIYYEHPDWFRPLFAALDRRGVAYEKILAPDHSFDPAVSRCPYRLVVNRVGARPSAGNDPRLVFYVEQYLAYLDSIGARVVNGAFSFRVGLSKARQLAIFEKLGLRYPRARVIYHPRQALAAAAGLTYPVLVKPNAGGSGAGIELFYSPAELEAAVGAGLLDLGADHTGLVQVYLRPRDRVIVRVEILNGEYLYAIRLPVVDGSFNYCPADGCNITREPAAAIESCTPPPEVIAAVKKILAASQADLGGVEYLVSEADGQVYYYDINPLSNFVANAPAIVGFDPVEKFVDFILDRPEA